MGKRSYCSREGSFSSQKLHFRGGDLAGQNIVGGSERGGVRFVPSGPLSYEMRTRVEDIQDEDSRRSSLNNSRNTDINGSADNGKGKLFYCIQYSY